MGVCSSIGKEAKKNHVKRVPERYSNQLYNSIVLIEINLGEKQFITGTGFFIKLNIKNVERYFLMTCQNVIEEKFIKEKKVITCYHDEKEKEKKIEIELDINKRNIKCFDKPYYVTLIEILEKDNIKKDKFLMPDLNYKEGYDYYTRNINNFYLCGYLSNKEKSFSSGKIKKILDKPNFEHNFEADYGNSGSPICLESNLFVVGIYKQGNKNASENYGIFLGYILDILEKEADDLKKETNKENKELNHTKNLLKNIKSKYLIKILFVYLNEEIKLKTI